MVLGARDLMIHIADLCLNVCLLKVMLFLAFFLPIVVVTVHGEVCAEMFVFFAQLAVSLLCVVLCVVSCRWSSSPFSVCSGAGCVQAGVTVLGSVIASAVRRRAPWIHCTAFHNGQKFRCGQPTGVTNSCFFFRLILLQGWL